MSRTRFSDLTQTPEQRFNPEAVSDLIRPEWFQGVSEAQLAKAVGLSQFGVNRVSLEPGSYSALRHWHEGEDEFVLVLDGELLLIDDDGEHRLQAGAFAGFPAGNQNAHHLHNASTKPASYLAIGTRLPSKDVIHYPDDDLGPKLR